MASNRDVQPRSRLLAYADSDYWRAVRDALVGQDRRILVFGPSRASGLVNVTQYVLRVLEQFGFDPHLPSEHGTVDFEMGRALEFPYIVSIVRTVGTAAETLTLLYRITQPSVGPPPRLLVVIPSEYRSAFFGRAIEQQFHISLETCSSKTCADEDLAIVVLRGVGAIILSNTQIQRSRSVSNFPFPASDQDRKSLDGKTLRRNTWQGGGHETISEQ